MNGKAAFLETLSALMADFEEHERTALLERFEEMIDDRMEMGMSELEAVRALGDAEALVRDYAPVNAPAPAEEVQADWFIPLREIRMHVKNADVEITAEALPEDIAARITVSDGHGFTWHLEAGVLTVQEAGEVRRGLFRRSRSVRLALNGCTLDTLIADTYGGDIVLTGIAISDMTVISTSSGDITLRDFHGTGRTELTTRSGDIGLRNVEVDGNCKLEALSGDIELIRFSAGTLRLRVASGDVDADGLCARTIALGTVSGDIEASNTQASESLLCESVSGDIDLRDVLAPDLRLSSERGDITVLLSPCPEGFDIQAESRSGEVRTPVASFTATPGCHLRAVTVSGDIDISAHA